MEHKEKPLVIRRRLFYGYLGLLVILFIIIAALVYALMQDNIAQLLETDPLAAFSMPLFPDITIGEEIEMTAVDDRVVTLSTGDEILWRMCGDKSDYSQTCDGDYQFYVALDSGEFALVPQYWSPSYSFPDNIVPYYLRDWSGGGYLTLYPEPDLESDSVLVRPALGLVTQGLNEEYQYLPYAEENTNILLYGLLLDEEGIWYLGEFYLASYEQTIVAWVYREGWDVYQHWGYHMPGLPLLHIASYNIDILDNDSQIEAHIPAGDLLFLTGEFNMFYLGHDFAGYYIVDGQWQRVFIPPRALELPENYLDYLFYVAGGGA